MRDTEAARRLAGDKFNHLGRMSRQEILLVVILVSVMIGWVTSPWHGIPNAFVALAGLSAILLCRVLVWDDLLAEGKAWDALVWFAPLLMMHQLQPRRNSRRPAHQIRNGGRKCPDEQHARCAQQPAASGKTGNGRPDAGKGKTA